MARNLTLMPLKSEETGDLARLLFGTPREVRPFGKSRQLAVFEPGDIFGFEHRAVSVQRSPYWCVGVVKCAVPGMEICRIPGVRPGGILLLWAVGKHHAPRALEAIKLVEMRAALNEVPAAFWQRLSTQLQAGLPVTDLIEREVW